MENEEETKMLGGKKMNLCKGQSVWSSGILFVFLHAVVCGQIMGMCEQLYVCVEVKEYVCTQRVFFKIVCTFKGRCLYQSTTAPELMRFRAENKAVHFNSLASGTRRPAVQEGATVAELYVCAR